MRLRIAFRRVSSDALVIRNSWRGLSESIKANRPAYNPQDQSIFVYRWLGVHVAYINKILVYYACN